MGTRNSTPTLSCTFTEDVHEFSKTLSNSLGRTASDQNRKNIIQQLNEWEHIPVDIAVTGSTGSGKSSLINALIGLTADDDGAAHIGVVETTKEMRVYVHPHYKNLRFWDLPGVGSSRFPQEQYLEYIQFDRYDIFIIVFSGRLRETDLWLASFVKNSHKTVIFVRTKIDIDVYSYNRAHSRHPKSETEILQIIREELVKWLPNLWMSETKVFLVDTFETSKYDFKIFSELW